MSVLQGTWRRVAADRAVLEEPAQQQAAVAGVSEKVRQTLTSHTRAVWWKGRAMAGTGKSGGRAVGEQGNEQGLPVDLRGQFGLGERWFRGRGRCRV